MSVAGILGCGPAVQPSSVPQGVEAPQTGAGRGEIQEQEAEQHRWMSLIEHRPEPLGGMSLEVRDRHFPGQEEGHWPGVEANEEEGATIGLEYAGPPAQAAERCRTP